MYLKFVSLVVLIVTSLNVQCQSHVKNTMNASIPVKIQWVESISGDFSFTQNWDYRLGVGLKSDGRPGCADGGMCPQRCYNMLDTNGIVFPDSAEIFYQLLDTTHWSHSVQCEAWCYEWAGTNYLKAIRINEDSITCFTACGIATHCSLQLGLSGDNCDATIDLNSIRSNGSAIFFCTEGFIKIDKNMWLKGILKAEFSFQFDHPNDPSRPVYWMGKTLSRILPDTHDGSYSPWDHQ